MAERARDDRQRWSAAAVPRGLCQRASLRWLLVVLVVLAGGAWAASPVDLYEFDSEAQEQRYQRLIAELRCPKCLNTNLAGSDAPIARDLRRTVHRLITEEGMSDAEVRGYLQARYGDFVLYDPPFRPDTWVLWLGPAVFLLIGVLVLWRILSRSRGTRLSASDTDRLRRILDSD